jgi:hypothetical protein
MPPRSRSVAGSAIAKLPPPRSNAAREPSLIHQTESAWV